VAVDEYPGYEGFVHVSEISLKWVRNIRDILREGQRNVFKIIRVNPETLQIDLSIKRSRRGRRWRSSSRSRRRSKVVRVMELFEKEAGKNAVQKVYAMESDPLKLYDLFEKIAGGVSVSEVLAGLTAQEAEVLQRLVTQEIKRREFVVKADIVLRCEDARGVEAIREAALAAEAAAGVGEVVEVKTKGSPTYMLAVKASTRRGLPSFMKRL
jgi:translation initiation factor 2 subunit 1